MALRNQVLLILDMSYKNMAIYVQEIIFTNSDRFVIIGSRREDDNLSRGTGWMLEMARAFGQLKRNKSNLTNECIDAFLNQD